MRAPGAVPVVGATCSQTLQNAAPRAVPMQMRLPLLLTDQAGHGRLEDLGNLRRWWRVATEGGQERVSMTLGGERSGTTAGWCECTRSHKHTRRQPARAWNAMLSLAGEAWSSEGGRGDGGRSAEGSPAVQNRVRRKPSDQTSGDPALQRGAWPAGTAPLGRAITRAAGTAGEGPAPSAHAGSHHVNGLAQSWLRVVSRAAWSGPNIWTT